MRWNGGRVSETKKQYLLIESSFYSNFWLSHTNWLGFLVSVSIFFHIPKKKKCANVHDHSVGQIWYIQRQQHTLFSISAKLHVNFPAKIKCMCPKNNLNPSVKSRRQLGLEQMQRTMSGICTHSCIWPRNQTHSYSTFRCICSNLW